MTEAEQLVFLSSMWAAELPKFALPVHIKFSLLWCTHTYINLMEDANVPIKDRTQSLCYTESIHN